MKTWGYVSIGVIGGLLAAGLLWIMASPPSGDAIQLRPAPTQAPITVHVDGAVRTPGVYTLPMGSRAGDAIRAAGGTREDAAASSITLAARLEDGSRVWVQPIPETALIAEPGGDSTVPTGIAARININTASAAELETLPGIGPATAAKIIAYREEHGPFSIPSEVQAVSGIGPATFARFEDLITTGVEA